MIQLTKKEVDTLYKNHPQIEDPSYPKKVLRGFGEVVDFEMKIGNKKYLVKSSPYTGDKWYRKYGEK